MRVGERPGRVEALAHGLEGVPAWVAGREVGGGPGVQLAPVRAGTEVVELGRDAGEPRRVVRPGREVDGEVGPVATVGGGEVGVVAGDEAALDRQRQGAVVAGEARPQPRDRLAERGPGDRQLHLDEAHPTRRGEHLVGALGVAALRQPAQHRVQRTEAARVDVDGADQRAVQRVADHLVADEPLEATARLRRTLRALVPLDQRQVVAAAAGRAGEPEQLRVVVAVDEGVEVGDHLVEVLDGLPRPQRERRHGAQRHRGRDPDRAEADPGRSQRRVVTGERGLGAGGVHQGHRGDGRGEVAEPRAGAVGAGLGGAGQRLHGDVAEVLERTAVGGQRRAHDVQRRAGAEGRLTGGGIEVVQAGQVSQVDQRVVGRDQSRERVPGADGPEPSPAGGRRGDRRGQRVGGSGGQAACGQGRLVAGPVAPPALPPHVLAPVRCRVRTTDPVTVDAQLAEPNVRSLRWVAW